MQKEEESHFKIFQKDLTTAYFLIKSSNNLLEIINLLKLFS